MTALQVAVAHIPAVCKTVEETVLVKPASEKFVEVPAVFGEVEEKQLVKSTTTAWRSTLCEINTAPGIVQQIQRAWLGKGFNPGPIGGVIDRASSAAIRAFQNANGFARLFCGQWCRLRACAPPG